MKALFLSAFAMACVATPCLGEDLDGKSLLKHCSALVKQLNGDRVSESEARDANFCIGYLYGFTDSHAIEIMAKPQDPLYCLPAAGIENAKLARIVTKYLKEHPKDLKESGRINVASALAGAFPCSKEK